MQIDALVILVMTSVLTWISYKLLLRRVTYERHKIFRSHFRNLWLHLINLTVLFAFYHSAHWAGPAHGWSHMAVAYIGLVTVIWGCIVLVKILRIIAYEYLFLTSMRAGVPLLIVNILTLLLSVIAFAWILKAIFRMDLTPFLATSAVLSIVLGLALQDTIGNLFAGISLQIDKPFSLGDWIEVKNGTDKIVGKVEEISWRATLLRALTDELITIPNRTMAQFQILNFKSRDLPFIRSQTFRIPHTANIATAKKVLLDGVKRVPGVLNYPEALVLITETTESWIAIKVVYSISDYGYQYIIADQVIEQSINNLSRAGIRLATNQMAVAMVPS